MTARHLTPSEHVRQAETELHLLKQDGDNPASWEPAVRAQMAIAHALIAIAKIQVEVNR